MKWFGGAPRTGPCERVHSTGGIGQVWISELCKAAGFTLQRGQGPESRSFTRRSVRRNQVQKMLGVDLHLSEKILTQVFSIRPDLSPLQLSPLEDFKIPALRSRPCEQLLRDLWAGRTDVLGRGRRMCR